MGKARRGPGPGQTRLPAWWLDGRQPALSRFGEYLLHARDFERRKAPPRGCSVAMRHAYERIQSVHEAALDRAWRQVGMISDGYSDEAASVVAEHYLFCEDWHDVAAAHGMGYDKVKKLAYAALSWLDGQEEW